MKEEEREYTWSDVQIEPAVETFLRRTNPWWEGQPMPSPPPFRRWLFDKALQRLKGTLAPITVVRGPRQIGKTTMQAQIIEHLLHQERINPKRIFRIQFDAIPPLKELSLPLFTLCWWFEKNILGETLNAFANRNEPVFLFFDEVQNLKDWSPELKSLVDHNAVHVLLTGSSALRIEYGRDSLAGRISTLELGTLLLREIASIRGWDAPPPLLYFNGLKPLKEKAFWETVRNQGIRYHETRDQAFAAFSERGGYPVAQIQTELSWEEVADQLNETVIQRVIQHDMRPNGRGRKRDAILFEEIFRLCCRYTGQAPGESIFINELRSSLETDFKWQRVLTYLQLLNDTLLMRLIPPLGFRLKRHQGRPKICLCDHSLRASWLEEVIPVASEELQRQPHLSDLAGHIAESIVGTFFSNIPGLDIAWFPKRGIEPEVDFVLTVGTDRIPLEIKYRRQIDGHRDTFGLRTFLEKTSYNVPFGVLITLTDDVSVDDPRIVALPLSSLLLMR